MVMMMMVILPCRSARNPHFPEVRERCMIRGVTLLNDKLYVLRQRLLKPVDVYSTEDFTHLPHISVPQLKNACFTDIASCVKKQCVFVSDCGNTCVYRVALNGALVKWRTKNLPWGLSVTRSGNLLVTGCDAEGKNGRLTELSTDDGHYVREIVLQADIHAPWHAAVLPNSGQYVVCHGDLTHNSRLTQVRDDGKVVQSNYGGEGLKEPRNLAVDDDGFIFVADSWHKRIVLFDPSLNRVRVNKVIGNMPFRPEYLCFDQVLGRLYVGRSDGVVIVVQMDAGH